MDETATAAELCRAANPDMPHRRCLRVKGHRDDQGVFGESQYRGLVAPHSWHSDYAGRWKDGD